MGIFDSKSTSTVTLPERGAGEEELMALLNSLMTQSAGQLGDLSDSANGKLPEISPEMMAYIENIGQGAANSQIESARGIRDENIRGSNESFASRGVDRSSGSAVNEAIIGRDFGREVNAIEGERADRVADLSYQTPFNQANLQNNTNQMLFQMLSNTGNTLNQNYLQDRLGRATTTGTTSGNMLTPLFGLGQSIGGAGGFNSLLGSATEENA